MELGRASHLQQRLGVCYSCRAVLVRLPWLRSISLSRSPRQGARAGPAVAADEPISREAHLGPRSSWLQPPPSVPTSHPHRLPRGSRPFPQSPQPQGWPLTALPGPLCPRRNSWLCTSFSHQHPNRALPDQNLTLFLPWDVQIPCAPGDFWAKDAQVPGRPSSPSHSGALLGPPSGPGPGLPYACICSAWSAPSPPGLLGAPSAAC